MVERDGIVRECDVIRDWILKKFCHLFYRISKFGD